MANGRRRSIDAVTHATGLTSAALAALQVPGISERWAAVQQHLHPALAALAEQFAAVAAQQFPRSWPLYEISYRSQRYINRGHGQRAPIDAYHVAFDRPPRGCGVYLALSAAEQRVVVALQLSGRRKADLQFVWEAGRAVWLPLVERLSDVRFAAGRHDVRDVPWPDRYLATRGAAYLLAGFAYRWDDPRLGTPAFTRQLIDDLLALVPLNEAIMERAEALETHSRVLLRETRASYTADDIPSIETIIARIKAQGMTISDTLIRAYHLALRTRPLVILPGISGTGKTRLTRLYADAVAGDLQPGDENQQYLLVAVQPDWHSPRDLLGYYNAISGQFHTTPFLRFLLRAAADPGATYYVCLDEMNLARPEYYLAPLLSALETTERLIDLGAPGSTVTAVSGEVIANPLRLPHNLAITGTVNIDESTHILSDKLLDRANVIELIDVDLAGFRANYRGVIDDASWATITQIHAIMSRAGQPFGYRVLHEIVRYLEHAEGVITPAAALDQQIMQKILPRLRGEATPRLRRALNELLELTLGMALPDATVSAEQLAAAPFPAAAEKLRRMLERLDSDGFTDFYG